MQNIDVGMLLRTMGKREERKYMQRKMLSCDVVSVEAPTDPRGVLTLECPLELSQVGQDGKPVCHGIWVTLKKA